MVSMALKKHYSEKQVIKNKSDYQIFIQHGTVKLNKEAIGWGDLCVMAACETKPKSQPGNASRL